MVYSLYDSIFSELANLNLCIHFTCYVDVKVMRIRIFPQGEGAVNSVGGLRPDTVVANITGDIRNFWKVLDNEGRILNWNGEVG